ncbi:MAG: thiolase family protein [Acidobacteria bacterium]|nr:thiolase family protein [Acidobacteriota bacterium]
MSFKDSLYPRARIPYGTWGTSFFPAWQTSALAEVNIGQFAAESMNRILGLRRVPTAALDYLILGSTIPWHWKFWNAPMLAATFGRRIPGYHLEQACATGLQATLAAAAQVEGHGGDVVGVLTFDRTSDSPVGVFPERRAYERTFALNDVWENFGFDPATGKAMIATAGAAARKHKLDRREVDEVVFYRYQQYFEAKQSGFLDRVCVPLDILNLQGKLMGRIDQDTGVRQITMEALGGMRELDTCVTGGGQTHAADGMATLLVTTQERAAELSPRPEIDIRLVARTETRANPGLMPEAPSLAVQKLFAQTGFTMKDIAVAKCHNPFAVNDVIFSKLLNHDWKEVNRTGCSLVWGHPQGPTLTRSLIEGLEEAVDLGGGLVLLFGCAAGDVGIAAIFEVGDRARAGKTDRRTQ